MGSQVSLFLSLSLACHFRKSLSTHEARKLFFKMFYNISSYKCRKESRWESWSITFLFIDMYTYVYVVHGKASRECEKLKTNSLIIIVISSFILNIQFFTFDIFHVNYARAEMFIFSHPTCAAGNSLNLFSIARL